MYVIPFSMGPIGGPLSKIGIELTDSRFGIVSISNENEEIGIVH